MQPLSKSDRVFLKHFAMVIAGLHVIAIVFLVIGFTIYSHHPPPTSPASRETVAGRIAPVGAVFSGETGRAAALEAAQAMTAQAGAGQAYGGTTDGKAIFDNLCHSCHEAGIAGAPKVGDAAAWKPRIAQGADTLLAHAVQGFQGKTGIMPPKGGNPALTDDQVKAAVEWMTAQVK